MCVRLEGHTMFAVLPDLAFHWTLGNFPKPVATISLPKSATFLDNFCKGVKIFKFSCEIIFRQLLSTFGYFLLLTLDVWKPLSVNLGV